MLSGQRCVCLVALVLWTEPNTRFGNTIARPNIPLAILVHRVILARTIYRLDI
jgi:hypothetical protein